MVWKPYSSYYILLPLPLPPANCHCYCYCYCYCHCHCYIPASDEAAFTSSIKLFMVNEITFSAGLG